MTIADQIAPGSAAAEAGYRALMARTAVLVGGRADRSSQALSAALSSTALGRIPPEERAWEDRISAYRNRLPTGAVTLSLDPRDRDRSEWLAEASAATRWMSLPTVVGRFLTRLVRELRPVSAIELGTGFGISTAHQAAALDLNDRGRVVSLDLPGMAAIAGPGLVGLELAERVELVPGKIETTLGDAVRRAAPIDYALLDADHTVRGTLAAFDAIAPALSPGAVVVTDDINWTGEMRQAWRAIRRRRGVSAAFAVRRLGIAIWAGGAG